MKINAALRQILPMSALVIAVIATTAGARATSGAGMTYDGAVSDALAIAEHRPELSVVRVAGQSMLPYFGDDAVVVVKKIDAARLRVGMIAVYVNRFGEKVAHRIISPVAGGWQVKGFNNAQADSTVVNSGNLLGIVYATFNSAGRDSATVAASHLPTLDTVYAAPAK
jgi:signal peptidase I